MRFNLLPDTDLLEHRCDNEKWANKTPGLISGADSDEN
jgi:hypothetical protein